MKPRITALLVHGMGHTPSWWNPLASELVDADIAAVALDMPSLETSGPEAWVEDIVHRAHGGPVVLIGHSLGAAACLSAFQRCPSSELILLACPLFADGVYPAVPPASGLSTRAIARVARFLRIASEQANGMTDAVTHIVGDRDPFVSVQLALRFPFHTIILPNATHELTRAPALAPALLERVAASPVGRKHLDPGVRARLLHPGTASIATALDLSSLAPPPARLDIEITTRCQLACPLCARTLHPGVASCPDMTPSLFEKAIEESEHCDELFFVGLGEPLLHPDLPAFVKRAAGAGLTPRLVTNGLLAAPDTLGRLRDNGLAEVTFSMDTLNPLRFRTLRGGASLDIVLANFKAVPEGLVKSVFVTLSRTNIGDLTDLVDLAAADGLRAIAVTDTNFEENFNLSLNASEDAAPLAAAIRYAHEKGILLISPHFHDFDNTLASLLRCRVRRVRDLSARHRRHTHCLAPWRIAVVGANGQMTPCNCAPLNGMGNMSGQSLTGVWNAPGFQAWRDAVMKGANAACLSCPRY